MKHRDNKNNTTIYPVILLVISFLLIGLIFPGCATSVLRKKGLAYYKVGEFDEAVRCLEQEHARRPKDVEVKTLLFRAKLKSYQYHLDLARKYREAKRKKEAIAEYKIAVGVFPMNKALEEELQAYKETGKLPQPKFKSVIVPPVSLQVDPNERISIKLPVAPIKKIFEILGKSSSVNIIFDKDFRDFNYGIQIENVGFYQVLKQLCMVSNSRYRILDSSSVLVYPDTTFKRRTFDLQGIKISYLCNVKVEDAKKLLMTIFRDQRIQAQEDKNLNSIIVKADSNTLRDIERFINSIDKAKSEVEIDVQIMEVNRNILKSLGTDIVPPSLSLTPGVVGTDGTVSNQNVNVNDLDGMNFFVTIPSAALNFLESDDNTRIISKPNLRGVSGEEIHFMVGEERPVPQTSFQSIAAGGINTVPMTTYQYKPVGVDIKITPYVHNNNEVTLDVKLDLKFVIGMVDQFPILGKRELESQIRLKEGETNIIGGFIRDEMRDTVAGITGLSKIPILGKLFGKTQKEIKQTDVIFSITPRVIRRLAISAADRAPIWANAETAPQGGGLVEPSRRSSREEERGKPTRRGANNISIVPARRKASVNGSAFFTIRMNSSTNLASLSVSGSIDGPKAVIEDLQTQSLNTKNVKVFRNFSGNNFDIGLSNLDRLSRSAMIGQLKLKFLEKGTYTITIDSSNAVSKDGQPVEFTTKSAVVEVQ